MATAGSGVTMLRRNSGWMVQVVPTLHGEECLFHKHAVGGINLEKEIHRYKLKIARLTLVDVCITAIVSKSHVFYVLNQYVFYAQSIASETAKDRRWASVI